MSGDISGGTTQSDADKRKAEAEAKRVELEVAEANSPAAKADKEAQHRKAEAEANLAAAKARRDEVALLIPDFSSIAASTLEVKGDQPLFGVALSQRALADAAAVIALDVTKALDGQGKTQEGQGDARVLITADEHLATSDAAYVDVTTGLDQLATTAKKLLDALATEEGERVAPIAAVGAIASALPGLVSLFAAKRTLTGSPLVASDLAAAAAVIGAVRAGRALNIVHDDVRLAPEEGKVQTHLSELRTRRDELTAKKLELEAQKTAAAAAKPTDEQRVAELQTRLGLIDSLAQATDAFLASLTVIPQGATRSRLTDAILRQQLHAGATDRFTHVLLIKSQGGGLNQLVDDRPLWFDDRFSIAAAISITYMLIETATSTALAAGTIAGSANGHGTIGKELILEIDVPQPSGMRR